MENPTYEELTKRAAYYVLRYQQTGDPAYNELARRLLERRVE